MDEKGNRLITANEMAKAMLDAGNEALKEHMPDATPEQVAEFWNGVSAWLFGPPPPSNQPPP